MYKIIVSGVVQGVGFRPYIYRKALELKQTGYVKNIGHGVEILVTDKDFIKKLTDLPPLAKITNHTIQEANESYDNFSIKPSTSSENETILPPDIFMCEDCKKELSNPQDRRNNYYFITCTNCGPRFSMIEDYPYDRPLTSMKEFDMCDQCKKEYTDPLNRRYHAQTIACKDCGPKLRLIKDNKEIETSTDLQTIKEACDIIKNGYPLSIKGIGGFHLCSLIKDVKKIRTLLKRPDKPFAIMCKDIEMAKQYATISTKEEELLLSPARPIVVLKKHDTKSTPEVSELDSIGIMLPYTALHYMLFNHINKPLVMTSCNIPGEPVLIKEKLGKNFLTHEREIVNRCDDSVIKIINNSPLYLRRSRGFTPLPIKLPEPVEDCLALGAELNNVIAIGKNNNCFLSQYIGNTSKLKTYEFMKETVHKLIHHTRLKPKIIICDLHPEYNSTILAKELSEKLSIPLIQIQHHKAHVASVAAEHNLKDYVGIAMDGLGYGEDGNIWGGEVFLSKNNQLTRIGHLEEQPQLGGDSATIYPSKMLFGILNRFMSTEETQNLNIYTKEEIALYQNMLKQDFNTPITTSAGRILDAVSALLGFCDKRTYDGRPAIILEANSTTPYNIEPVIIDNILSTTHLFKYIIQNLDKDRTKLAATTQIYLAKGLLNIAKQFSLPIVASGGVIYNNIITDFFLKNGVLINKNTPCGDGGICYGQVTLLKNKNLYKP